MLRELRPDSAPPEPRRPVTSHARHMACPHDRNLPITRVRPLGAEDELRVRALFDAMGDTQLPAERRASRVVRPTRADRKPPTRSEQGLEWASDLDQPLGEDALMPSVDHGEVEHTCCVDISQHHAHGTSPLERLTASAAILGPEEEALLQKFTNSRHLLKWSIQWPAPLGSPYAPPNELRESQHMRICFLNPFGTDAYDGLIGEVLAPTLTPGTDLEIRHLEAGPRNLDYYAPKQLVQVEILRAAKAAERDGFDAVIIGCVYDPALTEARELLQIPVVGPLEASLAFSRAFGHRFAIVTDHHKAVPEIEDRVRIYGAEANCRGVESLGWFVDDMVKDPDAVARDTYAHVQEVMRRTGAETVIVGCTIVSACFERACLSGAPFADVSAINPNVLAVKMAESLVGLQRVGQYRISRRAYYQALEAHDPVEAADVASYFTKEAQQL